MLTLFITTCYYANANKALHLSYSMWPFVNRWPITCIQSTHLGPGSAKVMVKDHKMAVQKQMVARHGHVADGHVGRGNVAAGHWNVAAGHEVLLENIVVEWDIGQIAVRGFGRMVVQQTGHMSV